MRTRIFAAIAFLFLAVPAAAQQTTIAQPKGCVSGSPCAASTMAIGGATIGTDALAVTGTSTLGGQTTIGGNLLPSATATRTLGSASAGWSSLSLDGNGGVAILTTDAADTASMRNGVNAQKFNLYNTYTDTSNYERGEVKWSGNIFEITTAQNGTGSARSIFVGPLGAANLWLGTSGTQRWTVDANGHLTAFADNTYDIGASGANRPRNIFVAGAGAFGGDVGTAGNFNLNTAQSLRWNSGDLILSRPAAATVHLGAADAAAPVAQTLGVQNVVAGTSNTVGTVFTVTGSRGTGTGVGGDIVFQIAPAGSTGTAQNALTTAFAIRGSGQADFTGLLTSSTNIRVSQTGFFYWLSGAAMSSPVEGVVRTTKNDGTSLPTVANLGSAATAGTGARATVSDSTVAGSGNFGATVTGGGANVVPVYSDGTNWKIG